jgi:hypothetical protein
MTFDPGPGAGRLHILDPRRTSTEPGTPKTNVAERQLTTALRRAAARTMLAPSVHNT